MTHTSAPTIPGVELRPIPSEPGYYAGSDGEIYSAKGYGGVPIRRLSATTARSTGYKYVSPSQKSIVVARPVHRLVAEAFHGPCPEGMLCRHIDGVGTNNLPENLQWNTVLVNARDRAIHGTQVRGEGHPGSKLTEDDVRRIRKIYPLCGVSHLSLAKKYGVSESLICSVLHRNSWAHLPDEAA